MNLRKVSMEIMTKEFLPFITMAIERHPTMIDVRIVRGNVVTAHDYARRVLIAARKNGIGKFTAQQCKTRPPIRVHYFKEGIAFSGIKRKEIKPTHWDDYRLPFDVLPAEDHRWVTLAINPSAEEIYTLAGLMTKGVLECPVELRTKFTMAEIESAVDLYGAKIHVFRNGRCTMLWPRRPEPALRMVDRSKTGRKRR